ncbi:helix-turn-helix transcriptional regulator [Paenibacillus aceris]|uniref:AraC-like DNA-binding protein n=1 Tax=Paenibacillus aceris TaxID=869555 RepID=A0ABS4I3E5_9BACL|nr:AraC family transcriptional regulator [Paenibacillus aceris]MBP1965325.1 AraC-like DNA-binding protein [Paenibacillus aceris]NHW36005.1 helix-turn-helix transcriptional regulator [Paenibacillus aceris]
MQIFNSFTLPFRLRSVEYLRLPSMRNINVTGNDSFHIFVGVAGRGRIHIKDEPEFVLSPSQAVIIMPNVQFTYDALDSQWEFAIVRFDCYFSALLQFRLQLQRPFLLHSKKRILELVEMLCKYENEDVDGTLKSSEIVYSMLAEIKLQLFNLHMKEPYSEFTTQKVVDYIHLHYSRKLTLEDISKEFGYTPQHLNKLFKSQLGHTIYQYILKVQLEQAKDLLESGGMTVEQVAERVGMESRSLYRIFNKMYKIPPGKFRKSSRRII